MPDLPNTTQPQSAADPQKLVDEALAVPTASSVPYPVPNPEPETVTPPTLPEEPALPPLEPVPPAMHETPLPEPVPEIKPIEPAPAPTSTPAEEMPLAFASAMPSTELPKTEETKVEATTTVPPVETGAVTDNTPPVFVPPVPASMTPPLPEKKKKGKGGKILATLVGLFVLIGGIVGGYYYYMSYYAAKPQIAVLDQSCYDKCRETKGTQVCKCQCGGECTRDDAQPGTGGTATSEMTTQASCKGCSQDGYEVVWRDGGCHKKAAKCGVDGSGKYVTQANTIENMGESACKASGSGGQWCEATDANGKHYAFCMRNDGSQGNCNTQAKEKGYVISTGSTYKTAVNGSCSDSGYTKKCTCGMGKEYCFSTTGYCGDEAGITDQTRMTGLCAITPDPAYTWASTSCKDITDTKCKVVPVGGNPDLVIQSLNDGIADWFNDNGLTLDSSVKNVYFCKNKFDNLITGCSTLDKNVNLNCFCGTIQIDTGNGFESRTMKCGCDKTTTTSASTPPTTPTLACSSITKDKATPKVGDVVEFTCAGTVTPAGATNLTYQFQVKKDAGEWTALTATGNKASYTVAAVGAYSARCKACGTINNASVCDPTWTGATQ